MHKTTRFLFLSSLLSLATASLPGAATRIAFVDPFATARGNAFTATADNASAVFYNAAGLTQLEGTSLQANVFAISLGYEYDSAFGSDAMDDDFQAVPSLFAAHKLADLPLAVGLVGHDVSSICRRSGRAPPPDPVGQSAGTAAGSKLASCAATQWLIAVKARSTWSEPMTNGLWSAPASIAASVGVTM